jgi:hypothetical protein
MRNSRQDDDPTNPQVAINALADQLSPLRGGAPT